LKVVSGNPAAGSASRLDGRALHQLADRLAEAVQAGCTESAQELVSGYELSPFGVAVVATWLTKAGLTEAKILEVMVAPPRAKYRHRLSSS
jgi:hypothetical protein